MLVGGEVGTELEAAVALVGGFLGRMGDEEEEEHSHCDVDDYRGLAHLIESREKERENERERDLLKMFG